VGFALLKFAIHLVTNLLQPHLGWGYFRDELYYIACGRHLAFGYVDHAPMVALQARLALLLFGKSLAGIRMFSALAGAARVFLTGMLCWRLGGRPSAQALAMLAVLLAPQYLGTDSFLSMNSFESMFWMLCLLALLQLVRTPAADHHMARLSWIVFGVSAGLGLENKPSMAFFLVALLVALLLTPERRLLFTRHAALGVAVLLLLAAPYLIWQIANHWPMLEFLRDGIKQHKNVALPPLAFLKQQMLMLNPVSAPILLAGLAWLLFAPRARGLRWLGLNYLLFLALLMALHGKDYYVAPIYPLLYAAGGVALLGVQRAPKGSPAGATRVPWLWASGMSAYAVMLILTGIVVLPAAIPVFTPEQQYAYLERMHLEGKPDEKWSQGPMKQFFSDRFGWQEMADAATQAYNSLSPADQQKAGIFGANYGDASAINFLAPQPADGSKLPTAVSGQNNYWLWGPHGYSGDVMILVINATPDEVRQYYDDVTVFRKETNGWAMPNERVYVYIARHRKQNFTADWPDMKEYI
jgi:hypothetical protein